MSDLNDFVRSFGMSGYLITEELKNIEQQSGMELGHLPKSRAASAVEDYPQFEQAVRIEAAEMSEHYEVIYCLEQSIRKLITETMQDAAGADWWNSGKVPQEVHQEVAKRLKTEKESGMTQRSTALIDYTTFGELSVIISANWDLFKTVLTDQRAVARVLSNLNLLRNPVAHCSPMAADEVERLRLSVKDWFRLIG
jgi:HEPN superfamily Swt1-like protein